MREELLAYYESELTYLRHLGAEFAEKYPKIASRLGLEPERSEDPHTERLIEAFAFLAARVHLKIDDEFPELSNTLLDTVYPHFLRPIPSMSAVEFQLDPEQGKLSTRLTIPRGSMLYSKAQIEGVACKFQTCYDTVLWPLRLSEAQWRTPDRLQPAIKASDAVGAIRLQVRCLPDVSFSKLSLNTLRFHLNGESNITHTLYELLCNNCTRIVIREPQGDGPSSSTIVTLPAENLRAVGFDEDEALLPYPRRSFAGYRLLQEYFAFPEKFLFFDLHGLDRLSKAGFRDRIEILFLISAFERPEREQGLELGVSASTFRLSCAPVVNLFPLTAEPIFLDQTKYEYPIVADVRRQMATEVFSVASVVSTHPQSPEVVEYEPFYAYRHAAEREKKQTFWHTSRRSNFQLHGQRTDVYLSLVDHSGRPAAPDADSLTVRCLCTNCNLPSRLPIGHESGDFELEGVSAVRKIVALRKPTGRLHPPTEKRAMWRLISHLSLNYLSLVEDGKEALQQMLRLYNFSETPHLQSQIAGITSLHSSRCFAPVFSELGTALVRGTRVEIRLDEEQFVGAGAYLFASVLERFFGMYVSLNSFSQLVAFTPQRKEVLRKWPPRAGRAILV